MKLEVGKTYHTHGSEDYPSFRIKIEEFSEGSYQGVGVDNGLPYRYLEDGTINNYEIFVALGYEDLAKAGALVAEA